ncbi:MAG: hypothetical protein JNM10_13505 [Planctomycetia bacterium]|nr:hypothetical protein [Planctomycetia bacterium]
MAFGSPCVPRSTAALALALLLSGCRGSPTAAGRAARSSDPELRGDPAAPPTATPPPAAVYVPPVDPLGVPPPPPGSRTSDRGDRLARPTPVGQLAPEDAPPTR